jgi:FemAB-related protein (PEP-CTERM system-associated)
MTRTTVPAASSAAHDDLSVSPDVTRDEWTAYVEAHPEASAYHQWDWRHVFEAAFHHRSEYLAARRGSAIVGVLPLVAFDHAVFGRFMVSLPFVNYGGILADDQPIRNALLAEAARRASAYGMSHVELRHTTPQFVHLPVRAHKVSMTMELPDDPERAFQNLDRTVRNRIRRAEKAGLSVESGGADLLEDFYGVFAANMRDLGTPVYPKQWFAEILARFPETTRLTIVRIDRTAVAGALAIGYRRRLEVPSAASLKEFRTTSANTLLYWSIMRKAVVDGYRVFDFGRSSPGDGPFTFKQRWGALPGPMHWEYVLGSGHSLPDRSPKNAKFSLAIRAWQLLPLAVTNRMGPSIVRFLP